MIQRTRPGDRYWRAADGMEPIGGTLRWLTMKTLVVVNLSRDRFTCEIGRTLPFTVTDLQLHQTTVSEDENVLSLIEPGVDQAIFTAEWCNNELILIGRLFEQTGSAPMSATVH